MSNLPIEKKKLNIWQRINVKLYLLRNYDPTRFAKAPDYIKQDDNVLEKMVKEEISKGIKSSNRKILIDLFRNKPYLFKNETREQIINYAMREEEYDIILNLSTEEQYNIISYEEYTSYEIEKMLEFANIDTVKLLIEKGSNKIDFLKYCNNEVQLDIISENNEFIQYASTEVQVQLAKQDNSKIELIDSYAQRQFLEGNIEFLNNHCEYIKIASKETQLLFASQNKEKLKFIDEKLQLDIISKRPQAFEYASETTKKHIFDTKEFRDSYKMEPFEIVNELLNYDMSYYKFVDYSKDSEIAIEHLKFLLEKLPNLEDEKIKEIFIKSGILSAMGNLRKNHTSFHTGWHDRRRNN